MYLCVCFMIIGAIWYIVCIRKKQQKTYGIYALVLFVSGALGWLAFISDSGSPTDQLADVISRPEPGKASLEQNYELEVDDLAICEPYQITVENRHLGADEQKELFAQAAGELEQAFLGENVSMDHITRPVVFLTDVMDGLITVSWTLDNYEVISLSGELQWDALTDEGTLVCATATMEYEDTEAMHRFSFMVYPPQQSETEQFFDLLAQALADENASTDAIFRLPRQVDGHRISWSKERGKLPYEILGLGILTVIGVMIGRREDERKRQLQRREQLLAEYPQMLGQMSLLIGAGMTVGYAWERLVQGYERQCTQSMHSGREQPVYEEMCTTYHQIRDGVSERIAYEQFGERIQLSVYRRFSTLLVQNLRKGTAGLGKLLEKEMQEALNAQESNIKKRGEELQTKLLLPMMLMLALVVVIIMIPALASFQL